MERKENETGATWFPPDRPPDQESVEVGANAH